MNHPHFKPEVEAAVVEVSVIGLAFIAGLFSRDLDFALFVLFLLVPVAGLEVERKLEAGKEEMSGTSCFLLVLSVVVLIIYHG